MIKRIIVVAGIVLLLFGIYLNRSFARIYSWIDSHYHSAPGGTSTLTLSTRSIQASFSTLNYVALGDSLTAGVGATSVSSTYPYILGQGLASGARVKLTNLGLPGARVVDVLTNELPEAYTLQPDRITLLIGINDVHRRTPLPLFEQNYRALLSGLEQIAPGKTTILTIPYLEDSALFYPPYPWYFDLQTRRYNERIKALAAEKNIPVIDLYTITKGNTQRPADFYSADLFHPSDSGYTWWAGLIYAHIRL